MTDSADDNKNSEKHKGEYAADNTGNCPAGRGDRTDANSPQATPPGVGRRRFFQYTTAAAATAAMSGKTLANAADNKTNSNDDNGGPSVIIARDPNRTAIDGSNVNQGIVQQLVDNAVMTLAEKDNIVDAWKQFVGADEKVAVKFNGLFAGATTHPEVVFSTTNGLVKAGVDPHNIVVYDRKDKAVRCANMELNKEGAGVRVYGTNDDYGPQIQPGGVQTRITNILRNADALVNLPVLKTHGGAGITGALKNHLGTVPNAWDFHPKTCKAVGDLNAVNEITQKTRICICDGIYGLFHGGPKFKPQFRWDYNGIIAATDPVAMDTVLADILRQKRVEQDMSPYHNDLGHIQRAAELGVGEGDLSKINRVQVEI